MNKLLRTLLSLLLCACMLMSAFALAEGTEPAAETTEAAAVTELADDTVIATVNGKDITWAQAKTIYSDIVNQYGAYYDLTLQENVDLFRAVALDNVIYENVLTAKAEELGMSDLTAEEIAQLDATSEEQWNSAIDSYMTYQAGITAESTEEEKAAAKTAAEAYFLEMGYTLDILKDETIRYAILDKVRASVVGDITVTDEDVEAYYQSLVAADKELYENDVAAYVDYNTQVDMMTYYAAMYGTENDMDYAWYKPAGFRAVKHILLPAKQELMDEYTNLQARYEEQQEAAAAAEEAGTEGDFAVEDEAAETVTAEQVSAAKAAILADLADKIEEINTKIAEGADFDELIATYGVNADGTPSDPGMANEPTKTTGYEVCAASSNYVTEFVEAAMSIPEVGGVSAPYLSSFGVHIVKYVADVPAGPVEMTEAQREAKRASLLAQRQEEAYSKALEDWKSAAAVTYTGVVPCIDDLMEE